VDALTRHPETTAVVVDKEQCIGCGLCVEACPFGYMQLDKSIKQAIKCDLCGGNPVCVQMCMANALHYGSINSLAELKCKHPDLRLGLRAVPDNEDDKQ